MTLSRIDRIKSAFNSLCDSRTSLVHPLVFSFLVVITALVGRFVIDLNASPHHSTSSGTPGKLLWILAPLLLAWLARRLDPVTRDAALFRLNFSVWRWAALIKLSTILTLIFLLYASLYFQMTNFMLEVLPAQTYVITIASITLFALIEECAWRGYLLPALLPRVSYPVALLFGAVICFCWHLPYLDQLAAVYTDEALTTLAPRVFIGLVAMQWLCAELWLRTGSVWPAFAVHATFNVLAGLGFVSGFRLLSDDAWLLSPSIDGGGMTVLMACGAGGLWWSRTRSTARKF